MNLYYNAITALPFLIIRGNTDYVITESANNTTTGNLAGDIILSAVLLMFSAMFSGLTLGILSLDKVSLEILSDGSDDDINTLYARGIIPIRENGNLLLCTLLIGNVCVNSLLSITMASFTSGTVGFLLSSSFIIIFGEITPQAVCSRYPLYFGYKSRYLVRILVVIFYIVAKPISAILDCILGEDIYEVRDRKYLVSLLSVYQKNKMINDVNLSPLLNVIRLDDIQISSFKHPIEEMKYIDKDEILSSDLLNRIQDYGFSRIPIHFKGLTNCFPYYIMSRDLFTLGTKITKKKTLSQWCDKYPKLRRMFIRVFDDQSIRYALDEMINAKSHIAIVQQLNPDDTISLTGFFTFEDIIEKVLEVEIDDEYDVSDDENPVAPAITISDSDRPSITAIDVNMKSDSDRPSFIATDFQKRCSSDRPSTISDSSNI